MEVQIISKETIKPALPTPHHLKTYHLSYIERIELGPPSIYIPFIYFYSSAGDRVRLSDHLKSSLSKALTHFYPLAGRVKDEFAIECNDEGATFIEAQVDCDMSFVVDDPEFSAMRKLLPFNRLQHYVLSDEHDRPVLLAVQANYFACGGMAIGVYITHIITDALSVANFVKCWADIARGAAADTIDGAVYDSSSLFPPQDLSETSKMMALLHHKLRGDLTEDEVVEKRFLFHGSNIAALRDEIMEDNTNGNGLGSFRPTRYEAVAALIWEALIAATADQNGEGSSSSSPILDAFNAVNLRKRMNPPLPKHCLGAICAFPMILNRKIEGRTSLARAIHESIKEIDDEYMRKIFRSSKCFNEFVEKQVEEMEKSKNRGMLCFSGWDRFPIYETDFGWGNPTWFGIAFKINRHALFVDASDGQGIEAWITVSKEEMIKFEQQPGIIVYSTFKPSI